MENNILLFNENNEYTINPDYKNIVDIIVNGKLFQDIIINSDITFDDCLKNIIDILLLNNELIILISNLHNNPENYFSIINFYQLHIPQINNHNDEFKNWKLLKGINDVAINDIFENINISLNKIENHILKC